MRNRLQGFPKKQGLYDPVFEHDSCGIGFLVQLSGEQSHEIVKNALSCLCNLNHRGAQGAEVDTGDGAGVLIQMPDRFYREVMAEGEILLPPVGFYAAGLFFAKGTDSQNEKVKALFEEIVRDEGQKILGWRYPARNNKILGASALAAEPEITMPFVERSKNIDSQDAFERRLYVIRKRFESELEKRGLGNLDSYYFPSLSSRTIVYKGMLTPDQLGDYYPELGDERVESALAMYHSRFSTNTFPSWKLAHPYRTIVHNGEINTLRGNKNWMKAREAFFESPYFEDIEKVLPIIDEDGSDTACLDNAVEFLTLAGRPIEHVMMMLIPEAWSGHETMDEQKKAFYEYHSLLTEPWDGPASVGFTDGKTIGAVLDRNGLRPSRYVVTKDGLVIMGSEVGVLPVQPDEVLTKGRLEPGRMFLVSLEEGRIIEDAELKERFASQKPYSEWLKNNLVQLEDLEPGEVGSPINGQALVEQQIAFGYSVEDQKYHLAPMALAGQEAIGSMGSDTPLAVLSDRSQSLYNYFKQLFAQVTNPPLDAMREELVTSVETTLGPEGNLLDADLGDGYNMIALRTPFLSNVGLSRLKNLETPKKGFHSAVLPMVMPVTDEKGGLTAALDELFRQAKSAIADGANLLILSDRGVDKDNMPIPALLATAGLHHFLVREKLRTKVAIIVESGDPREVHHFALLIGYGANAINPYLAIDLIDEMVTEEVISIKREEAVENLLKALKKGVVKVMSKMGISTVQSYRGAQIYEAIGLNQDLIEAYFTNTVSRISGIGIEEIEEEVFKNHRIAWPDQEGSLQHVSWGGQYQWRFDGENHLFNPDTIFKLQHSTRSGAFNIFREYTDGVNSQAEKMSTLRGLMDLKSDREPISIEEVEPVESIFKRFATGAMSFGSISAEAHETLAIAMNRIGGKSNTGEGGEDPRRFEPDANGDLRRSAIKQVASGRFGVTSEYLVNADELQIKMAQGAKPGEGGQLPGHKVWPWIAEVRYSTPGVALISPPPHHDIYSIEDLAQLIHDLKNSNPRARISVKLVAEVGVGTVAAGVAKAKSDVVLISGFDGGTGASPLTSIKHAGVPWELGLAETQQTLVLNNLRDRIVVQVDGQMKTGRDVIIGALLGAEEFGFATAPLVVMGCIMMRVCHLDTCPVGIATQNPVLREKFNGQADHIVNFFHFIAEEVRMILSDLGYRSLDDIIGRSDLINPKAAIDHWKAKGVDISPILHRPEVSADIATRRVREQDHGLSKALDQQLLKVAVPALDDALRVEGNFEINNTNRVVGTILGSEVTRKHGRAGLPENTIQFSFNGSAGQSFGAFIPKGMTFTLNGDANDYFAKGLSGGHIVLRPQQGSSFIPEENVIAGNVALYGATSGEVFIRGLVGERFCVRNSGAIAVVEGTGDHCCEYMTGGRVIVLGATGRNFGAGMSGGIAYVYDEEGDFSIRCNTEMVALEEVVSTDDQQFLKSYIERHKECTNSSVADQILKDWASSLKKFVRVMPLEYRRVLEEQAQDLSVEANHG